MPACVRVVRGDVPSVMGGKSRVSRRAGIVAFCCATVLVVSGISWAGTSAAPAGSTGHDISYPQCSGSSISAGAGHLGGQFGIVGVTNGRAWSANPCLGSEYQWAAGLPSTPGLYTNTANPAPTSSYYWPTSGSTDPVLCEKSTSTTDPGCAYDYGWHTGKN